MKKKFSKGDIFPGIVGLIHGYFALAGEVTVVGMGFPSVDETCVPR